MQALETQWNDAGSCRAFRLELAAYHEFMMLFVKACYTMEGDRLELLLAHEIIVRLHETGDTLGDDGTTPHTDNMFRQLHKIKKGDKVSIRQPNCEIWSGFVEDQVTF